MDDSSSTEGGDYRLLFSFLSGQFTMNPLEGGHIAALFAIAACLLLSALISGAEVAFFSLSSKEFHLLRNEQSKSSKWILYLLNRPRTLLATILIGNNLVNVAIIITSYWLIDKIFNAFEQFQIIGFAINVIGVTFLLVLFGEVVPKIYATQNNLKMARFMALPLVAMRFIFRPVSYVLVSSTRIFEKKLNIGESDVLDPEDIHHAIDLTADSKTSSQEISILKGIVKFGNINVKQIMRSRVDVVAVDEEMSFEELLRYVKDAGYSRLPVFRESLDSIVGVLYVKDLLAYVDKQSDFKWQHLIRPPFFVPETKKIDDLLKEIQANGIHLAIVVDEYGGTSGIITLEDILEEVIGEIKDEFDISAEIEFTKLDGSNYIFEGKTLLNDICKVLNMQPETFDDIKGDADSLAGLLLELSGKMPVKNEEIRYENFLFTVLSLGKNRIEKVKITILKNEEYK